MRFWKDKLSPPALAAVVDSFELNDQQPQTYSQYVPGKYVTTFEDGIEGEESAEYYVQFNEDHTGLIHMQDDISVIWYSRDGVVLNADTGEQIYEYNVEGDSLPGSKRLRKTKRY